MYSFIDTGFVIITVVFMTIIKLYNFLQLTIIIIIIIIFMIAIHFITAINNNITTTTNTNTPLLLLILLLLLVFIVVFVFSSWPNTIFTVTAAAVDTVLEESVCLFLCFWTSSFMRRYVWFMLQSLDRIFHHYYSIIS